MTQQPWGQTTPWGNHPDIRPSGFNQPPGPGPNFNPPVDPRYYRPQARPGQYPQRPNPYGYTPQAASKPGQWGQPAQHGAWGPTAPQVSPSFTPRSRQLYAGRVVPGQSSWYESPGSAYSTSLPTYSRRPTSSKGRKSSIFLLLLFLMVVPSLISMIMGTVFLISRPTGPGVDYYDNEGYDIPPVTESSAQLPIPSSTDEAIRLAENNPIYLQPHAKPVRCELSPVNLQTMSDEELEAEFNKFSGCLTRVWGPAIESAGYDVVRSEIIVYTGSVQSACGKLPEYNAAFCSADQKIYFSSELVDILPPKMQAYPYLAEAVLAHEYGHAVQAVTGILMSGHYLAYYEAVSESEELLLYRRLEAQADCFAGIFVGSVKSSVGLSNGDIENLKSIFKYIGSADDEVTDHGTGNSRRRWFKTGVDSDKISSCNTWTVPADQVP